MKPYVPFLIAGVLIGVLLTIQLRSDVVSVSSYPLDEYEFQKEVIQSFVDDQIALEERLNELTQQVEEAEQSVSDLYGSIDSDYLQGLKDTLGLSAVSGESVEIVLDDSESVDREGVILDSNGLVHAADLRDLMNLLRSFPFEGLAINGQRVVSVTPIKSAGSTILVNNFNVAPPFTVQIITDIPDLVIQRLSHEPDLPGIYARMASHGLEFKFKKIEEITIPAYIGGYPTQFLTHVENET